MADETKISGRLVAVTGAGGFIGGAVCRKLAAEGASVRGLDVDASRESLVRDSGAEFAVADVTDREGLAEALEGAELVVHAAAYVREWGDMAEFVRVNVGGTANVLDAAAAAGAERVLHLSSVVTYGYEARGEQSEDGYLRACGNPYVDTKSASERVARRRGAVVIRPGDVYGPRSVPWTLRILEMAKAGQIVVPSDVGLMWPVYVDDLADAVALGLRRGRDGAVYTCYWDERPVTYEEYFNEYARMAGRRPVRRVPRPVAAAAAAAAELYSRLSGSPPPFNRFSVAYLGRPGTASTARAREELGWAPKVGLEEGIGRTEAWLRSEGLLRH
jgi:nucleoside-diphosphate-sugar epimerase